MIALLLAAFVGAAVTVVAAAGSFGLLVGLSMAPLGGSAFALGAGLLIATRSKKSDLSRTTSEQVGALREVLVLANGEKSKAPSSADRRSAA